MWCGADEACQSGGVVYGHNLGSVRHMDEVHLETSDARADDDAKRKKSARRQRRLKRAREASEAATRMENEKEALQARVTSLEALCFERFEEEDDGDVAPLEELGTLKLQPVDAMYEAASSSFYFRCTCGLLYGHANVLPDPGAFLLPCLFIMLQIASLNTVWQATWFSWYASAANYDEEFYSEAGLPHPSKWVGMTGDVSNGDKVFGVVLIVAVPLVFCSINVFFCTRSELTQAKAGFILTRQYMNDLLRREGRLRRRERHAAAWRRRLEHAAAQRRLPHPDARRLGEDADARLDGWRVGRVLAVDAVVRATTQGGPPAIGSMTPMHDGSRTPMHSSVWDPLAPNTPLHRPSTPSSSSQYGGGGGGRQDEFEQQWAAMGGGGGSDSFSYGGAGGGSLSMGGIGALAGSHISLPRGWNALSFSRHPPAHPLPSPRQASRPLLLAATALGRCGRPARVVSLRPPRGLRAPPRQTRPASRPPAAAPRRRCCRSGCSSRSRRRATRASAASSSR